jgi:uncharacterized integral membrane protein (TIGR00698 family)
VGQKVKGLISPDWKQAIPGIIVCILFAYLAMNLSHTFKVLHQEGVEWATFLYVSAQFKYVAILLLGGILIRNTVGVPQSWMRGIMAARPIIKPGIILLGVHYVWSDVIKVGGVGLLLTTVFIFGTAASVMVLSKKFGTPDGLGGIMAAGTGICGVSAIIATAPVVRSKPRDLAYAIGTVLLFGTVMLFIFPYIGIALGLAESQFGAWVALAILNTAQLIACAEWYGAGARDTAVLINAARIMFIPVIVLFSLWYYVIKGQASNSLGRGGEAAASANNAPEVNIDKWQLFKDKFPVFIIGFFIFVALNSAKTGLFGGPDVEGSAFWAVNNMYKWFFAVGFAGIGLMISIDDLKKAGGTAFAIGFGAAAAKAILGLIAVYLIGAELLTVVGG